MTPEEMQIEATFLAIKHNLSAHERDCLIRIANKKAKQTDYILDKIIKPLNIAVNTPFFHYLEDWYVGTYTAYITPYENAHSKDDVIPFVCTHCTTRFSVYMQSKHLFSLCRMCDAAKKAGERYGYP